jgi:dethiobiotin synthetase
VRVPADPPAQLWLVAGTGTEVGKTWIASALIRSLRAAGLRVGARKPVQSFESGDLADASTDAPTDADLLAAASGEPAEVVCPRHRWYERAMAPPMAAAALSRPPFTIADLVDELGWPEAVDVGVVESAGGVRSPLASDGDTVDLARALSPTLVVLVADAGLGTINAVRLSGRAFGDDPLVVVLNRYDETNELHRANRAWLADRDGFDLVVDAGALTRRVATPR